MRVGGTGKRSGTGVNDVVSVSFNFERLKFTAEVENPKALRFSCATRQQAITNEFSKTVRKRLSLASLKAYRSRP